MATPFPEPSHRFPKSPERPPEAKPAAPTRAPYILKSKLHGGRIETVTFNADYLQRLAARDPFVEQHFAVYFGELLYIKLRSRIHSPQLVEDVRQETLMRVLRTVRAHGIEHPERLGAYVVAVCNNVMLESFRTETRFRDMNEDSSLLLDSRMGADETFVSMERKQHVAAVLKEMPRKDGDLIRLVFLEEQDKDTVCRQFGVDRAYLRVLLHRARLRFKDLYTKAYAANM